MSNLPLNITITDTSSHPELVSGSKEGTKVITMANLQDAHTDTTSDREDLTQNIVDTKTFPLKTGGNATMRTLEDGTKIIYKETSKTGGATIEVQTVSGNINMHIHLGN